MTDRKRSLPSALAHGLPTARGVEDIRRALTVFSRRAEEGQNSEIVSRGFAEMTPDEQTDWLISRPRVHIVHPLGFAQEQGVEVARDVRKGVLLCWMQEQWKFFPLRHTGLFYPDAPIRSGQLKLHVHFGNKCYGLNFGEIDQFSYTGYGRDSSETYGRFEFPMASASAHIFL